MQTRFQLGNYIHAYTNVTHSLTIRQDLIPGMRNYKQHRPTKVGIKLNPVELLENVFHLCMHGYNQLI